MKKFQGTLICTDLDGTLLRGNNDVSPENREAIEYFKSEGGYFTFITGRPPYISRSIYEMVRPNAPIGCFNGGGIFDFESGEYLWKQAMAHDVLELVQYADQNVEGIGIQVNGFDQLYFCTENEMMEYFRYLVGIPKTEMHYLDTNFPIAKILFGDLVTEHISKLAELLPKHPKAEQFEFVCSEETLFEILPKGIHKGTVLPILAERLGVDPRHTIAVGDYDNDVGMIREAGIGFAVANASPAAKAAADYVTVSNDEHAIARIIWDLDAGRLKFPQ